MQDFEVIYREYFPRIFAFLYKLSSDRSLSEELAQETFYQAYISFYRYNFSCELFTWLCAIAKNVYFKHLRHEKNKCPMPDFDIEETVQTETPETTALEREETERLRRAIARLPEKYRDIVILRTYAELPYAQIARLKKISESSAKVIFCRAKEMIKEMLS